MFMNKDRLKEIIGFAGVKKPGKQKAFENVRFLINDLPESFYEDHKIVLAELFKFFTPPVSKKPKDNFGWCALAAGNDQRRPFLNYVYVVDAYQMVATNGHRIHIAPNSENLEPGFYCPKTKVKVKKIGEVKYPDYERLLTYKNLEPAELKWEKRTSDIKQIPFIAVTKDTNGNDYAFDLKYFEEALCGFTDDFKWIPGESGLDRAFMVSETHIAVLMPVRI